MTDPINIAAARSARRRAADSGQSVPTPEQVAAVIAENAAQLERAIEAGERVKPISTWQEIADWVDEATWQRILDDLSPETRAECERIRPPASLIKRQAEALERLRRQSPARVTVPTADQPAY